MTQVMTVNSTAIENQSLISELLVGQFIKFAGVSEKSASTYITSLRQMNRYFTDNAIVNPSRDNLENWRDSLIEAGKSASTVQLYITSAKLFFRWTALEGIYSNIADNLKSRVKPSTGHKRDCLSAAQAKELIQVAGGKSIVETRNQAIVALMSACGLRTIEVVRANVGDIRRKGGANFLYVQGKGRNDKAECVRLPAQVEKLIRRYLKERGKVDADSPLFAGHSNRNNGGRITTQSIRKMVKAGLRAIGLDDKRLSAHSLRHTAATVMLMAGVSVEKVQMVLRHRNITTTMVYAHNINRLNNDAENYAASAIFAA